MEENTLQRIVTALPSPSSARQLAIYLAREADPGAALEALQAAVEESDEDLPSWLRAFTVLADYIDGTVHRPTLLQALGYLDCCQAVISSGTRYEDFPQTVETLLGTYGYDGHTGEADT